MLAVSKGRAVRFWGSPTVSSDECRRVVTQGTRGDPLDSNGEVYRYKYLGRTYHVTRRNSIRGRLVITAHTARR